MCGIYMTIQQTDVHAGEKVFAGLKKIEYRGYDSWGVVVLNKFGFTLKKRTGKLSKLGQMHFVEGKCALGHTRWATHGGVTKENAHPHLAKNKSFVLAQNGVVENFQELREQLLDWGYDFDSETDTEVIVGLLEFEMEQQKEQKLTSKIIRSVFRKLTGRNTIAILTQSGDSFAVRDGSPLIVGRSKDSAEIYFSSDVVSLSGDAVEYVVIQSGQMVEYVGKKLKITEVKSGRLVPFSFVPMSLDATVVDKEGYSSFMLKEIYEQAKVLSKVVVGKEKEFKAVAKTIKNAKTVFMLGAGTASYAAGHTAYILRKLGVPAVAIASYESDSFKRLCDENSVCIVYSQSGETADTNEVVEWMKAKGAKIISAVNMPGSTLTQLSDFPFLLQVGPELAVASTKAFFGQMVWGMTVCELLSGSKFVEIKEIIYKFEQQLRVWFADTLVQDKIRKLAESLVHKQHLFVLGRGDLYSSSLESALKLKEISYIHAEGFSGGELKHGVIALIEQGTPVLCLVAEDENKANMLNAISEINARGGFTIVIASKDNELYKEWIEVPELKFRGMSFMTLMSIVPSQLLTCYMAMKKGFDVDKPRNLAKSVTVK